MSTTTSLHAFLKTTLFSSKGTTPSSSGEFADIVSPLDCRAARDSLLIIMITIPGFIAVSIFLSLSSVICVSLGIPTIPSTLEQASDAYQYQDILLTRNTTTGYVDIHLFNAGSEEELFAWRNISTFRGSVGYQCVRLILYWNVIRMLTCLSPFTCRYPQSR